MAEVTDAHIAAIRHQAAKKAWLKRQRAGQQPAGAGQPKAGQQSDYLNPHAQREADLISSPVVKNEFLGGGITETKKVELANGEVGCFKPDSGDPRFVVRDGITPGQGSDREAAAWEVAKLGGMDDMMQPVVIRQVGGERGSFSAWSDGVPAKMANERYGSNPSDLHRAAVFDYIIGNQDRHAGNWIVSPDGRIKMIDHGLSFGESKAGSGNHAFQKRVRDQLQGAGQPRWDGALQRYVRGPSGDTFAATLSSHVGPYSKNKSAIREKLLKTGLPSAAVARVMTRISRAEKARSASDWATLMNSKG